MGWTNPKERVICCSLNLFIHLFYFNCFVVIFCVWTYYYCWILKCFCVFFCLFMLLKKIKGHSHCQHKHCLNYHTITIWLLTVILKKIWSNFYYIIIHYAIFAYIMGMYDICIIKFKYEQIILKHYQHESGALCSVFSFLVCVSLFCDYN